MNLSRSRIVFVIVTLAVLLSSLALVFAHVRSKTRRNNASLARTNQLPQVILWAWERPSDLRFIDPHQVGVAFLAQSILLRGDHVIAKPRLQPLEFPPATVLIAVTRVESDRRQAPQLSEAQLKRLSAAIGELATLPRVSAVQIDFDATRSERQFYRDLIVDVRRRLPQHASLSITALASWCAGDDWLSDLPIDEAVPMLFRMGPDRDSIMNRVSDGRAFSSPACSKSYGISTDEPVPGLSPGKRLYVFNPRAWNEDSVRAIVDSAR